MHEARETLAPRRAEPVLSESTTAKPLFGFDDNWGRRGQLAVRQDTFAVACGYFAFAGSWKPWCTSTSCKANVDGYFGCGSILYTTCYPKTDPLCAPGASLASDELCCSCMIGIKSQEGGGVTAYQRAIDAYSGELDVFNTPEDATLDFETTLSARPTADGTNGIVGSGADADTVTNGSGSKLPSELSWEESLEDWLCWP
ncbi:hypothetical protein B0T10DRAFT_456961 [Thelonectria olida]|uniref:Uncharacterized protein n=1 Tax=Thelonectria olida TaxID=1576542 RepID=A0A9P8WEM8_9HYPO|nr:hypothetical protein B0T10DRAFT_456961 [Thelonectria olida]